MNVEEAAMTYLKVLSCHLPGETEENHKNLQIAHLQLEFEPCTFHI